MGRSPCCEKAHMNKGAWTKEEDQLLVDYIRKHGEGCWRSLPRAAGNIFILSIYTEKEADIEIYKKFDRVAEMW